MGAPSSPPTRVHGTLVEIAGVGVLLLGPSGIGKSECAIELVLRGFRFVADDVVLLQPDEGGGLIGEGPDLVRHHIELRGIGIVHVPSLFGTASVANSASVDVVVELEPWGSQEVERTGLDRRLLQVAGVEMPSVRLPVGPGRNVATLVEVAAREFRHRQVAGGAAELLEERIERRLAQGTPRGPSEQPPGDDS